MLFINAVAVAKGIMTIIMTMNVNANQAKVTIMLMATNANVNQLKDIIMKVVNVDTITDKNIKPAHSIWKGAGFLIYESQGIFVIVVM
jgi:hypothetical protein